MSICCVLKKNDNKFLIIRKIIIGYECFILFNKYDFNIYKLVLYIYKNVLLIILIIF